jgi:hypothetical protein
VGLNLNLKQFRLVGLRQSFAWKTADLAILLLFTEVVGFLSYLHLPMLSSSRSTTAELPSS